MTSPAVEVASRSSLRLEVQQLGAWHLCKAVASDVHRLSPALFQQRVTELYLALLGQLHARGPLHAVRFWNFLPHIHQASGEGLDRYMIFNAGRFEAFCSWAGDNPRSGRMLPTATGVGHQGDDLAVLCLASAKPGRNIENPRQTPAYQYSARYGPLPPCFARATLIEPVSDADAPLMLVGGTASVRGEDSVHLDSLHGQTLETLANLASLVSAAEHRCEPVSEAEQSQCLSHYRELRIYHPRESDGSAIDECMAKHLPRTTRIERVQADLCRPELLIEIEGLAQLQLGQHGAPA